MYKFSFCALSVYTRT